MIVRIEYGDRDHCVEIDLLDTVAAKKWLFALNENLKIGIEKFLHCLILDECFYKHERLPIQENHD